MKKIEFSEQQIKNIIEMYNGYIPISQITKEYCVNKKVIYNLLKQHNVELHGERRVLSSSQVLDVVSLYEAGMSLNAIASKYNVNRWTIKHCLEENNIDIRDKSHSYRKYNVNENFFDVVDTPEKAYVLGMLWSDGCNKRDRNCVALKLQCGDKKILEEIKTVMESTHPLVFYKSTRPNCQDMYALEIVNKHLSEKLEELGMHAAKSLTLEFPVWLDSKLYPAYLRGVVDGDGSVSKDSHHNSVSIVGTNSFCMSIQNILNGMSIKSTIYGYNPNGITKSLCISRKEDSKKFLDWIYKDSTIHLERKYNTYIYKYCSDKNINDTLTA